MNSLIINLYLLFFCLLWVSCTKKDQTIKIKGSDTEVNLSVLFAETYHKINPGLFISVSGGGSGLGIASLLNGTADIANSSRRIKNTEIDLFKNKEIAIDSFIFAQDAIAFVVAKDLPIDSITIDNLRNILNGNLKNWLTITGIDIPVNIYGRQSNSGTHEFIKKKLAIEFSPYAKEMNGNAQILEAIKEDHSGIGYVGAGYIMNGKNNSIKVLLIKPDKNSKAVSPFDRGMILTGNYYFQRPLFQYFKSNTYKKIKPFLDFEKSIKGRSIIELSGYYPVNQQQ